MCGSGPEGQQDIHRGEIIYPSTLAYGVVADITNRFWTSAQLEMGFTSRRGEGELKLMRTEWRCI
jgi:hypothetical protein